MSKSGGTPSRSLSGKVLDVLGAFRADSTELTLSRHALGAAVRAAARGISRSLGSAAARGRNRQVSTSPS
jgi:hypothetical protein